MKIFLSDFDGTLVNTDILDVLCGINGKENESRILNEEFISGKREGLPTLKARIDFLKGITPKQIERQLNQKNYLVAGAKSLFNFLHDNNFITVLHSGNIIPVLEYYQRELKIDYIVGNHPRIGDDGSIQGIGLDDFSCNDFKYEGCKKIISELKISRKDVFAIGDSPSDMNVFSLATTIIVINPKCGIEKEADYVLKNSLTELIPILRGII